MKIWETLTMKPDPNNKYDNHAIELHWQNVKVGFVPMSDNTNLTAIKLLVDMEQLGILVETTGYARNRTYLFGDYMKCFFND